jgi:hypothetical protein
MSIKFFPAALFTLFLTGCATNFQAPPLSANNPASAEAREAATPAARPMLRRDALTEKTNEQLASTSSGSPSFQPSKMQQMHHAMKGMEGMQHGDSGATKMDSPQNKLNTAKSYYTCFMHPNVHQDKPGKCPICGATLVKEEKEQK